MSFDILTEHFKNNFESEAKRVSRYVPNYADAEDIVQEAYTRAIQYWYTYDPERPLEQWFRTMVRNASIDWKKQDRMSGMTVKVDESNGGILEEEGPNRELSRVVYAEISSIKQVKTKSVIYRRFAMGLPYKTIAEVMDMSEEAVKKSIQRWRAYMKDKYAIAV